MADARGGLSFAVDALAVQRLTRLMVEDDITDPLRAWLSENSPPTSATVQVIVTPSYVAFCPYCASIYGHRDDGDRTRPLRFLRPVVYALALADGTALIATTRS